MYRIFDYLVESHIPLPELSEAGVGAAQFRFELFPPCKSIKDHDWVHHWRSDDTEISISLARQEQGYLLRFPILADFYLEQDCRVINCFPHTDIPGSTIRHLLLDQVLPRVIAHEGEIVLHASAVKVNGQAILFIGEAGYGKSTLATSFNIQGSPLVADDSVILRFDNNQLVGIPHYPGTRIFPDTIAALIHENKTLGTMAHYSTKKRWVPEGSFHPEGIRIGAIFMLHIAEGESGHDAEVYIEEVEGSEKIIELIRHSFSLDITDKEKVSEKFIQISHVANCAVPIYRIKYPHAYSLLEKVNLKINQQLEKSGPYQNASLS